MIYDRLFRQAVLRAARSVMQEHLGLAEYHRDEVFKDIPIPQEYCGAFVTLKRSNGELRGCIGTVVGEEPLVATIERYARAAAFEDPRFPPVTRGELGGLTIEISVLTPMRRISDWREIHLGTDGIMLRYGFRRALFLPQVAVEQGWDVETTLTHLAMKAGLSRPDTIWRDEDCEFLVFQAQVWAEGEKHV